MKWQAIANVTNQVKEEAKNSLIYKLQKDASVEIPHLWGDFESETTKHLYDCQSNIEVMPNDKTGGLSCVTKFDELHPDFLENNNKLFTTYALEKYDKRAGNILANVKNPFTRKSLENKIGNYRVDFANNINHTDIKLVEGKRHVLAIESIEKLKNNIYDHSQHYQNHLQDCTTAINSLSLLPLEKEQLLRQAQSELAGAASLGMLKNSPDTLINQVRLPPESQPLWMQHLSLEQRVKLDNQLKHTLEHRQVMRQHEIGLAIKSNKESILATGEPVKGIDNLVTAVYGRGSRQFEHFKQEENFYKQAFSVTDQIKHASIEDGSKLLAALKPVGGDPDFYNKQNIYNIALKLHDEQLRQAQLDPARLVEELYIDEFPKDISFQERILRRQLLQEQKGIPDYARRYLTKAEKAEFIRKIEDGKDINEIRANIDGIIAMRDNNGNNYGLEIAKELFSGCDSELFMSLYAENRLYGRNNLADIFLKMIPYKGQLFNSGEEREFSNEINKNISKWEKGFYNQSDQNTEEIDKVKQEIKYLALHYKKSGELTTSKAVEKAIDKVIGSRYMSVTKDKLQIPNQMIVDDKIENLNEPYVEASLNEVRRKIINRDIDYDYYTSFGIADENIIPSEVEIKKLREVVSNGKWNLTPDKKSVYFTYLTEGGEYLPLMAAPNEILKFELKDLNTPDSLEHQKQIFREAALLSHRYRTIP